MKYVNKLTLRSPILRVRIISVSTGNQPNFGSGTQLSRRWPPFLYGFWQGLASPTFLATFSEASGGLLLVHSLSRAEFPYR
eukprot:SAG31_NODE_1301_length_8904_cov_19.129926_1_plen_81_part_00